MQGEEPADGWSENQNDSHHSPIRARHNLTGRPSRFDGSPARGDSEGVSSRRDCGRLCNEKKGVVPR